MGLYSQISRAFGGSDSSTSLSLYRPSQNNNVLAKSNKGFTTLPQYQPQHGGKAMMWDPMYVLRQMGYKDRVSMLAFDIQRKFAEQLGVINAIIQVRANQVAAFAQPYRLTRTLGFQIRHKDREHRLTESEREVIKKLELMFMQCGRGPNPFERGPRPDFEAMLKMSVRDSLTMDQDCLEIYPDHRGVPYSWRQIDASRIRLASPNVIFKQSDNATNPYGENVPVYEASFIDQLGKTEFTPDDILYVQVLNEQITAVFSEKDLLFSIRNPTTDVRTAGYGISEIEMVVNNVTAHLNAERFNYNQFRHGSDPEGILNIKDEHFDPEQLESFRRQWRTEVSGVENSHRLGILQAADLQFIPFGKAQKDAQFMEWMEYLIKVTTGVFLIDPDEINMYMRGHAEAGAAQAVGMMQDNRIKLSKDKGLRPILRFQAKKMQKILDRIDDHFYFEFVGLDEMSEQEKLEKSKTEAAIYKTINEVRAEHDKPPIEYGDVPANPTLVQWAQIQQEREERLRQEQMQQQQMNQATQFVDRFSRDTDYDGTGNRGGVPVGHTTGANPRVKYANENIVDKPNKSLNAEKRIELIIEE